MKAFSLLALLLLAFPAFSGELFDNFSTLTNFSADFVQTNHYAGVEEFSRKGKVYISRPTIALWDYPEPPPEFYILEPNLITHYSAELEQLAKLRANPQKSDDPSGIILGIFLDTSTVRERFMVEEGKDKITLTPKREMGIENVVLKFNKNTILSVFSEDVNGNTILIEFSKVSYKAIPPERFKKEVPKKTSIYEQ
ncbi:MAG: outer membrane lipoprotein carrier protein LolA [Deferribacteraceae bacterium]|jgi:outer membrane lipoprotein-sorting protein|nr:outer membrane lipoprotein carrier protein LolA [Deferribacteraceae bacterium]